VKAAIRFRAELLDEVAEAYGWYEERGAGLGDEFLRAFYAAVSKIQRQPTLFRAVYSDFRRLFLRRFPYFLYYRIEQDTIVFILLFHCARHPRVMRRELRKRQEEDQ
jgi:plasmid stabilization system protein ParE